MALKQRIERPEAITLQSDELLAQVKSGRIRLPAFQRLHAWSALDAVRLFESIYLGYPTGSLVFWETRSQAESVRFGEWEQRVDADSRAWKIVDGQQRITTLVGYAFDMPPRGERIIFEPLTETFHQEPKLGLGLSVSTLFDAERLLDWQSELDDHPRKRELIRHTNKAQKRLLEHRFPAIVLRAADAETVLEVFRRVNLMGRALSEADVFFLLTWNPEAASKGVDPLLNDAIDRVREDAEIEREWLPDPFGWPELAYLADNHELIRAHVRLSGVVPVLKFEMPKSAKASRPAVLLDIEDRVAFQALVDALAPTIQKHIGPEVFGWRVSRKPGGALYERSGFEWLNYSRKGRSLATKYDGMAHFDVARFFASIGDAHLKRLVSSENPGMASMWARLCDMVRGWQRGGTPGLPQRAFPSSIIANAVLLSVDHRLREWAAEHDAAFVRWMDDVTVFADTYETLAVAEQVLRGALAEIGLELNEQKTSYDMTAGVKTFPKGVLEYIAVGEQMEAGELQQARAELSAATESATRTELLRLTGITPASEVEGWGEIVAQIPHVADGLARMLLRTEKTHLAPAWVNLLAKGTYNAQIPWARAQLIRVFPPSVHESWINNWCKRMAKPPFLPPVEMAAAIPHLVRRGRIVELMVAADEAPDVFSRRWGIWGAIQAGASEDWIRSFFRRHPELELTWLTWQSGKWHFLANRG